MEITPDFITPIIELRHQLHAGAELSGEEKGTAEMIQSFLQQCKPSQIKKNLGGHGILATYDSGKAGPVILFRCELDALPIQEVNELEYCSAKKGVSHKCGHDGHMAILCGLAAALAEEPPVSGKVLLLFQPAEETGEGAKAVCNDAHFDVQPDFVFALHNIPGSAEDLVLVKEGTFSAAVNSMIIRLTGKATHAAQPESGQNPSNTIAEITRFCDQLNNNNPASIDFRLVTPVYVNVGSEAYGTAAGEGEIHFTLRAWNNEALNRLENIIGEAVAALSAKAGVTHAISYTQGFYANTNHCEANKLVRNAAAICGLAVEEKDAAFKWGEDFGFFTSKYKGCMFGLGAGTTHADLHNPDYDFPDSIISSGVKMFYQISKLTTGKNV